MGRGIENAEMSVMGMTVWADDSSSYNEVEVAWAESVGCMVR